ncbi:MAG: CHAP domain-containing protein [Bdellovibrionales bacterium]|jgi:hypothetical protein|nr:CHAP domain-containing protein [Bdellovibrionales bacterium]MBT3525480.1 CHAP domain-containing protein [Bdellovibrionales bacterium]MBT7670247.1 CHAP domain-containing protein [Bdellovibrionales bacterium]
MSKYTLLLAVTLISLLFSTTELGATNSGNSIVQTARGELGNDDSDPGFEPDGRYQADGVNNWCSEFVSWVYDQAGYPFTGGSLGGWMKWNTVQIRDWFSDNSTYVERDGGDWGRLQPQPGDYVFISRASNPGRAHSGIVKRVDSRGGLWTIEGNNAGRVVDEYYYPSFRTNDSSDLPAETNGIVMGFGLRTGKNIRLNGSASASSSGNNRSPYRAFDGNSSTFWRNRTNQTGSQWLELKFNSAQTVTKVRLTFGSHYCRNYKFRVKRSSGSWHYVKTITGNSRRNRAHVWFTPQENVKRIRIYCTRYSADDYFSLYEMEVMK